MPSLCKSLSDTRSLGLHLVTIVELADRADLSKLSLADHTSRPMNASQIAKFMMCLSANDAVPILTCRALSPCRHILHVLLMVLFIPICSLHILTQPSDAFTVTLSEHNAAHEDFDGSDALEWHLPLACCLVKTKHVSQLLLADSLWMIDLVA